MTKPETRMRSEICEIPQAVARLAQRPTGNIETAAAELRRIDPHLFVTVARGSSDHASAFLKYAIELSTGLPVASIGPSVASIYDTPLKLDRAACLSISQSGKSPDIVRMAEAAGQGGALTIALTNGTGSPLAESSEHAIDILAGPESSVAATKTFVSSIVSGLLLLGHWQRDADLLLAIEKLPEQCAAAIACDWSKLADVVSDQEALFILGRGPSMAIANEVALKFKETCQIQAEAYSSAEVMHGPVSIVGSGFPVLALASRDAAEVSVVDVADRLCGQGADVFVTSSLAWQARELPFIATGHRLTDPLVLVVAFYAFIEQLARRRGLDPDQPPHLNKVTQTV